MKFLRKFETLNSIYTEIRGEVDDDYNQRENLRICWTLLQNVAYVLQVNGVGDHALKSLQALAYIYHYSYKNQLIGGMLLHFQKFYLIYAIIF